MAVVAVVNVVTVEDRVKDFRHCSLCGGKEWTVAQAAITEYRCPVVMTPVQCDIWEVHLNMLLCSRETGRCRACNTWDGYEPPPTSVARQKY